MSATALQYLERVFKTAKPDQIEYLSTSTKRVKTIYSSAASRADHSYDDEERRFKRSARLKRSGHKKRAWGLQEAMKMLAKLKGVVLFRLTYAPDYDEVYHITVTKDEYEVTVDWIDRIEQYYDYTTGACGTSEVTRKLLKVGDDTCIHVPRIVKALQAILA